MKASCQVLDFKTAPSFARSPKVGVFDRVSARGREIGERGEEGVTVPGKKGNESKIRIFGLLQKEVVLLELCQLSKW